jgi:glycosyltransferase involved in cell wall biosynthesis
MVTVHIDNGVLIDHAGEEPTVLYLWGWAFAGHSGLQSVRVRRGTVVQEISDVALPRPEVCERYRTDSNFLSGFEGLLFMEKPSADGDADITLEADFSDGTSESFPLESPVPRKANLAILPAVHAQLDALAAAAPRIAICMGTYNPPSALFRKQIESLRAQTLKDWVCIVSDDCSAPTAFNEICELIGDDPRFIISRNTERLGITDNFEHTLKYVLSGCKYVAFADQDDKWRADKLEKLAGFLDSNPAVDLVYSDMRIVDREGKVIAPTYWTTRRNSYSDLTSLFLANTVTGAASMFRRELLKVALPFPYSPGRIFHDHWVACVAAANSSIAYVDEPLYDYVQHPDQDIGHTAPRLSALLRDTKLLLHILDALGSPKLYEGLNKDIYFCDVIRLRLMAATLIARLAAGDEMRLGRRLVALRRVYNLGNSSRSVLLLLWRGMLRFGRRSETIGAELYLLRGLAWRFAQTRRTLLRPVRLLRTVGRRLLLPALLRLAQASSLVRPAQRPGRRASEPYYEFAVSSVHDVAKKIEPVPLQITDRPPTINFLIPTLDPSIVFAGYLTKFNLIRRLLERGTSVRLVVVDSSLTDLSLLQPQLNGFPGIRDALRKTEVFFAFGRKASLPVSRQDIFIATTWWTAHIAQAACEELGCNEFVYLIQEFEPALFPFGSYHTLALETYGFKHFAVFSTDILRRYFENHRLGVFADQATSGPDNWVSIRPAITNVRVPSLEQFATRKSRKILFYARPEPHAARNLYELGILALNRALERDLIPSDWELWGIGGLGGSEAIPLAQGRSLHMIPRRSQENYATLLEGFDVGMSLMYAPHPSLVPLDLARAGTVTLTTEFENKTAAELSRISGNIIAVPATVTALANGLGRAIRQADDVERRVAEAAFDWPTSWDETFDDLVMSRIARGLNRCCAFADAAPATCN